MKTSLVTRKPVIGWMLISMLLAIVGCSGLSVAPQTAERQRIIEAALGQLGRPYRYGGASPSGFDCSGLVQYAYAEAGVVVPRNTQAQRKAGRRVSLDDAAPGDLLFYRFERGGLHVGLYVGDGRMIHAPVTGKTVSLVEVSAPVWKRRYLETIRLLDQDKLPMSATK